MTDRISRVFATTGDKTSVPELSVGNELSFDKGWSNAYEIPQGTAGALDIDRGQHNFLWSAITGNIKQWQEQNAPQWFADIDYPPFAQVEYLGDQYITLKDGSAAGVLPTNATYWISFKDLSGSQLSLGKMGQTFTADATFTSIDNKIVMTGVESALGLEIGDVIQFSNAGADNNKARTVESLSPLVVNYEHCGARGNGSLKLTDETVIGATVKLLSKGFIARDGLGQDWVDVKAFRATTTDFQNNTNRSIEVAVTSNTGASTQYAEFEASGIIIDSSTKDGALSSNHTSVGGTVTPTKIYNIPLASSFPIDVWGELR